MGWTEAEATDGLQGDRSNHGTRTVRRKHDAANYSHKRRPSQPRQTSTQQRSTLRLDWRGHAKPQRRQSRRTHATVARGLWQREGHPNVLTRMWTGACGFTSLNAKHWSSSWTISAGISLRMIFETGRRGRGTTPAADTSRRKHSAAGNMFHPAKRHASNTTAVNHPRTAGGGSPRPKPRIHHQRGPSACENDYGNTQLRRGQGTEASEIQAVPRFHSRALPTKQ